ncbi:MAG: TonB-dependent receptor [Pseudomonadales bacterium]|nr:TonB-dependent receptor [Pseudomonadales bacterium]
MKGKSRLLAELVLGLMLGELSGQAMAYDLGVVVNNAPAGESAPPPGSAPDVAPTQGSLSASEPQSVIGQQYIQNNVTGASNYTDVAQLAPSVWSVSPNGPGGSDWPGLSMRAFQDGQYNVMFDGIPFADGADFTHHVSSYFMASDIGDMVVDRGPGDAGTIGDATFGGTISVHSKDPGSDAALTPTISSGSFNSNLEGLQFDTGVMQNYGDFNGFIDYNHFTTDGYLTNNHSQRDNIFAKFVKPISENTVVTFVGMDNRTQQNASLGATTAQIAQYGSNFGLNLNPNSQAYIGYNQDIFNSDLSYIGIKSQLDSWKIDNKTYTYSYTHAGLQGQDPNGATPNGTTLNNINLPNDIPGQSSLTHYTSIGDILRVIKAVGLSDLSFGLWLDRQSHNSWTNNIDLSLGSAITAVNQNEQSSDTTLQPYVEYAWRPNTDTTVKAGVKYNSFNRYYNAAVDGSTGGPINYSKTWNALLPSLDVHYYIEDDWSVYGQVAEGFVAPNLNVFSNSDPAFATSNLQPQHTMNYQTGTTWKTDKVTVSGDLYYIENNNQSQNITVNGLTSYVNIGDVKYKGIETEATYSLGRGYSLYGNLTFNSTDSLTQIQNAPSRTAAAGLIFSDGRLYSSLLAKQIGPRYSGFDVYGNPSVHLGSYTVTNFSVSYKLLNYFSWTRNPKIEIGLDNLFNQQAIIQSSGNTGTALNNANASMGDPLFYTLPGRSITATLSSKF